MNYGLIKPSWNCKGNISHCVFGKIKHFISPEEHQWDMVVAALFSGFTFSDMEQGLLSMY